MAVELYARGTPYLRGSGGPGANPLGLLKPLLGHEIHISEDKQIIFGI